LHDARFKLLEAVQDDEERVGRCEVQVAVPHCMLRVVFSWLSG
jgi:hypothetical protein